MRLFKPSSKQENYYIFTTTGGAGDELIFYFEDTAFSRIQDISKNKNIKLNILCLSYNSASYDLYKHNPYISNVYTRSDLDLVKNMKDLREYPFLFNYKSSTHEVYLDDAEKNVLNSLDKEYVVLHPFAGDSERDMASRIDLIKLIDYLIDKVNVKVVLLGGSHFNSYKNRNSDEYFGYNRSGLVNLINRTSYRLSLRIVGKAKRFIGTHSCLQMASKYYSVPCFCVVRDDFPLFLYQHHLGENAKKWYVDYLFKKGNMICYFNQLNNLNYFLNGWFGLENKKPKVIHNLVKKRI